MANVVQRRGMMAAVAAAAAALIASNKTQQVEAANNDPMLVGNNHTGTATTTLTVSGGGSNGAFNVSNTIGVGIVSVANGTNANAGFGVNAYSAGSAGVNSNSGASHGVQGGTTAASVYGLYGSTSSTGGGVFGTGGAAGFGAVGRGGGGSAGIFGQSDTGPGVYGLGTSGVGVSGQSSNQIAVYGISTNATGVYGQSNSNSQYGVYGKGSHIGVGGEGNTYGVQAFSPAGTALNASTTTGLAAAFTGRVTMSENLDVTGNLTVQGQKSAVVRDKNNQLRRLYCVESPDSVFEDYGEGRLSGGTVRVNLEDGFAGVVLLDHYLVYLTPTSETPGLFVVNRDQTGFDVREVGAGTGTASFCWRVIAKRRDIEAPRLQRVEARDVRDSSGGDVRQRSKSGSVITVTDSDRTDAPNTPDAPNLPAAPAIPGAETQAPPTRSR